MGTPLVLSEDIYFEYVKFLEMKMTKGSEKKYKAGRFDQKS